MDEVVLDASALLALLNRERGHEKVAAVLAKAKVSAVNLAEVGARLVGKGQPIAQVSGTLDGLGAEVIPFDEKQALETIRLHPLTRSLKLSLSDRACLALARMLRLPAMTTDRAWANLHIGVVVEVIR